MGNSISAGRPTDTEQAPRGPVENTASEQVTDKENDQENRTKQSDQESGTSVAASGNKRPFWNRLVSYLPNLRRPQAGTVQAATVIENTATDNTAAVAKAPEETPPPKSTGPEPTVVNQAVDDEKRAPATVTDKPPDPTPTPKISASQETPKETPKEVPKDAPQRAAPKEEERIDPAPTPKISASQEIPKETAKETPKETPKDVPQQATPKEEERNEISFSDPSERTAAPPPPQPAAAASGKGANTAAEPPKKRNDALDTTSVPYEFIKDHYRRKADSNDYIGVNDGQFVFRDEGKTLWTKSEDLHVSETFTEFAKERRWAEITAKGSLEFRRNVWLQGNLRGIEVHGYEFQKEDVDQLNALRKGNAVEFGKPAAAAAAETLPPPNPAEEKKDQADDKAPPPKKENDKKGGKEDENKKEEKKGGKTAASAGAGQPAPESTGSAKNPAQASGPQRTDEKRDAGKKNFKPIRGVLLEHGEDYYEHNKEKDRNYYVALDVGEGKKPLEKWSMDFKRAIAESQSKPKEGDKVVLLFQGSVPFIHKSGQERKYNRWLVEKEEYYDRVVKDGADNRNSQPAEKTAVAAPDQRTAASPDKKGSRDFTALERRNIVAKVQEIRREVEHGGAGRGKISNYLNSNRVTWAMLNYWETQIAQEDAAASTARQASVAAHHAEKSQQLAAAVKEPLAKGQSQGMGL